MQADIHQTFKHMPGWECPSGVNGKGSSETRGTTVPCTNIHVVNLSLLYSLCLCTSCPGPHQSWLRCAACGIGPFFPYYILVAGASIPAALCCLLTERVFPVSGTAKPECKYPKQQQDTNAIISKQD